MSKLLINEPPLQVLPSLAKAIGINEAVVLQQIHYWVSQKRHLYDGRYWTYNTYEDWNEQFSYMSKSGLRKVIHRLESKGLVMSHNYNKNSFDHTKWYTINYETLNSYTPKVTTDVTTKDTSDVTTKDTSINTKTTLEYRESTFRNEVKQLTKYNSQMINDFSDYWTEPNKSRTKMRWELERTFDINRRMQTWARNSKKFGDNEQGNIVKL